MNRTSGMVRSVCLACAFFWAAAATLRAQRAGSPEEAFARAYDVERVDGNPEKAVEIYRSVLEGGAPVSRDLAARTLMRIAVCRKQTGAADEARRTWELIVDQYRDQEETARRAQSELAALSAEMENARIDGMVEGPDGKPVADAYVTAGDWLFDSAASSDGKGAFSIVRKTARHNIYNFRYCLVYAEASDRYLAGLSVVRAGTNRQYGATARLAPMVSISGRVVGGAQRESGIAGADVLIEARTTDGEPVHVPYGLILPQIRSDPDGRFCVSNIVPGLKYRIGARKSGFRLESAASALATTQVIGVCEVVMAEEEKMFISGRVANEAGGPLWARVTVFSMPPDSVELGRASTDQNGRYRVDFLPSGKVIARAESEGYGARSLSGVTTGCENAHFALGRIAPTSVVSSTKASRPQAAASEAPIENGVKPEVAVELVAGTGNGRVGGQASELAAIWVNAPPLTLSSLRGNVVLLYFWSRRERARPPVELKRLNDEWADRGLRIVCIHDHSGYVAEVSGLVDEEDIRYPVGIDMYCPGAGGLNSLTMSRYGSGGGEVVLINRSGAAVWIGSFTPKAAGAEAGGGEREAELGRRIEALLAEAPSGDALAADAAGSSELGEGVAVGMPALDLSVGKWIRGEPVNGGPVRLSDLKGKVVVLHFASVYAAASMEKGRADFVSHLEQVVALYGKKGVVGVWVLPSGDESRDAEAFLTRRYGNIPAGIDEGGATHSAYGVAGFSENCVIDRDGIIRAVGVSDAALFRVVKDVCLSR